MKGIILAGGSGTRLYPLTQVTSKQLLPVYDKPMIFYPLSVLMMAEIKDILIISTPTDISRFKDLLGDGSIFGINLSYKVQPKPEGLAQAFLIGEEFIKNEPCAMILGDNIMYGNGFKKNLIKAKEDADNGISTLFGYYVNDPERYGVLVFDKNGKVSSIEEKSSSPKSNFAVIGLYFYDKNVVEYAKQVKPSSRGELEITDLNNIYLKKEKVKITTFGRGFSWLDAGTHESLAEATAFVKMIEDHQGLKISCPEEIAYINGWITKKQLLDRASFMENNEYGQYLKKVAEGKIIY